VRSEKVRWMRAACDKEFKSNFFKEVVGSIFIPMFRLISQSRVT
jgi:hypothetical protein